MEDQCKQHGAFSWCELMTSDPAAAKTFYGTLFGWTCQDWPMPDMTYTTVSVQGREIGGIMAIPREAQGMPPMWGAYVTVDDVEATARTAESLGGKVIVPPSDIPDVGRFCVIQDPQGATINVITYRQA